MQFNEPNPANWQALITQYFPDGVAIAEVIRGGVIFFSDMESYYAWKAAQSNN